MSEQSITSSNGSEAIGETGELRIGDTEELRSYENGDGKSTKRRRVTKEVIVDTARNWDKKDVNRGIILALALIVVVIVSMLLTKISILWTILGKLLSAMTAVFIGLAFAYILNPLHNFLTRLLKKLTMKWCKTESKANSLASGIGLTLTILLCVGVIIGLLAILLPQLEESLVSLYNKLPSYFNSIREYLNNLFKNSPSVQEIINNYLTNFETTMSTIFKETLLPNMDSIIASVSSGIMGGVSFIIQIFVGLIISIYVLAQKKKLGAQAKKLLFSVCSKKRGTQVLEATGYVNSVFGGFVNGKIVDSLMIGVLCAVFCSIVNMPYALLVSVIIGVTNIIPFFGPFIGAIPSALLILVEDPKMALVFIIFILVLQQLDANLVQPVVLGDATGLSGIWVLFAITVGSSLFGVVGMILSVPVFAIIYTIFTIFLRHRLKNKKMTNQTEYYYDLVGFDDEGNPIRGSRGKKKMSRRDKSKNKRRNRNKQIKKNGDEQKKEDPGFSNETGFIELPDEEEREKLTEKTADEGLIQAVEKAAENNSVSRPANAKRVDGKKNRQNRQGQKNQGNKPNQQK